DDGSACGTRLSRHTREAGNRSDQKRCCSRKQVGEGVCVLLAAAYADRTSSSSRIKSDDGSTTRDERDQPGATRRVTALKIGAVSAEPGSDSQSPDAGRHGRGGGL